MYRERCIVSLQSYNDKNIPKAMPWGYFARFTKRLVKLRPVLTGGGLGVVVVVGGFHDVVVGPMLLNVRERGQLVGVLVHEVLVSGAAQHVVDNGRHFRAGDGVVGTERAVAVAVNPAVT